MSNPGEMLRCYAIGLAALALLLVAIEPTAEDREPCGWSPRWNENHTTKPVELNKSIELTKIVDAPINWPLANGGHSGAPILEYVIGPGGMVEEVRFLRTPVFRPPWPDADEAILDAIYQWQYEPVVIDGVLVPVCVLMTINVCWS